MKKDVDNIVKALDLLSTACGNIQECRQCEHCPIGHVCLEGKYGETTLVEIADLVCGSRWEDFLTYADECLPSESVLEDMAYAAAADYGRDEL